MFQQQKKYLIIIGLAMGIFTLSYIATTRYQIILRVRESTSSNVINAKEDNVKLKTDKLQDFLTRSSKTSTLFDEFRTKDGEAEQKLKRSSIDHVDETTRLGNRHETLSKTFSKHERANLSKSEASSCDKLDLMTKPPKRYFGRGGVVRDPYEVPKYSEADLAKRMKERKQRVQRYCETLHLDPKNRTQRLLEARIFIDREHKYLFCPHGKVASSTWFAMFLSITGYTPYNHSSLYNSRGWAMRPIFSKLINQNGSGNLVYTYYTKYQGNLDEVVKSYRKWVVVRHPLEILASAYRNKVVDDIQFPFRRRIKSRRQPGKSYGDIPSFAETVDYRCDPSSCDFHDAHWDDYLHHCAPCDIEYDYIAHYETVIEDAKYIFSQLHFPYKELPKRVHSDLAKFNLSLPTSDETLAKYVQGLGKKRLKKLYDLYRHDLHMFGYINC